MKKNKGRKTFKYPRIRGNQEMPIYSWEKRGHGLELRKYISDSEYEAVGYWDGEELEYETKS